MILEIIHKKEKVTILNVRLKLKKVLMFWLMQFAG